jgi:hypothetical protein
MRGVCGVACMLDARGVCGAACAQHNVLRRLGARKVARGADARVERQKEDTAEAEGLQPDARDDLIEHVAAALVAPELGRAEYEQRERARGEERPFVVVLHEDAQQAHRGDGAHAIDEGQRGVGEDRVRVEDGDGHRVPKGGHVVGDPREQRRVKVTKSEDHLLCRHAATAARVRDSQSASGLAVPWGVRVGSHGVWGREE